MQIVLVHARFTLDGHQYSLPRNNGENTLHGGPQGFNNVVWRARTAENGIELTYNSKDGEEAFPVPSLRRYATHSLEAICESHIRPQPTSRLSSI
jgi:galactose mutarotase-like enzyme